MRWRRAEDIGARIRELRTALGVTQEEFGELAGVEGQQVSDWETGRSRPRTNRLERLAGKLRITVEVFAEGGPSPTVAVERARLPQEGQTTRGPGRRQEDIDLRAEGLKKDAARLDILVRLIRSYRDAGESPSPDILAEWLSIVQANSPGAGPPAR
jgi:transcriptional regulator with XRE-family HTH domain